MEKWQRNFITRNLEELIKLTCCNPVLLSTLESGGIFCQNDVEDLNALAHVPLQQADKFYKKIITREDGFKKLLEGLEKTMQSGALRLLSDAEESIEGNGFSDDGFSYDEKSVIGKGSNGTVVYKGKLGERKVAVKRILRNIVDDKTIIEEIKVLKSCDSHENVVRYFNIKESQQHVLIILELCDITLNDWVANKSLLISPVEVLRQTTTGLEWLHSQRIVHRDLKPENILINSLVKVKISDFGLSRRIVDGKSCVSTVSTGTQGWLAPEVLQQIVTASDTEKCKFTFASDVFALGCVYYYVLSDGKHAFGDMVRRNGNILDGKVSTDVKDMRYVCSEILLFIHLMISVRAGSRPCCSTLLSSPIFWERERYICFLQSIMESKAVEEVYKVKEGDEACSIDHCVEAGALNKKPGCVVPLAYVLCQDNASLKQYYSSKYKFSVEMVAEVKMKLKDEEGDMKRSVNEERIVKSQSSENMRCAESRGNSRRLKRSISAYNIGQTRNVPKFNSLCLDNEEAEKMCKTVKFLEELERTDPKYLLTKLMDIVKTEDLYTMEKVIEGLNINVPELWDYKQKSLLHVAISKRDYDIVKYMVNSVRFSNVLETHNFKHIIMHCITKIHKLSDEKFKDKCNIIEFLVKKSPRLINSRDEQGRTALHIATERDFENNRQYELIELLLLNNADPNACDNTDRTPLHYVVKHEHLPPNLMDIIKLLIRFKVNPDGVDIHGYTFLHLAAYHVPGNLYHEIVEYLVSENMTESFDIATKNGSTVLHFAVYYLEPLIETLETFKTHHVDFNAVKENGESVMFSAIKGGRSDEFIKLLIKFDADWTVLNENKSTALHYASSWTNITALKLFISLGCDLNAKNKFGNTPLHEVFLENSGEKAHQVVQELVANGAYVGFKNNNGELPIDLARKLFTYWKLEHRTVELLEAASSIPHTQHFVYILQHQGRLFNIFSAYWRL